MDSVHSKVAPEGQIQEPPKGKPRIEIQTTGVRGKILINGEDVSKGVRGYEVIHKAGCVPTLTVTFNALDLSVDGNFVPQLPEPWSDHYEIVLKDSGNSSAKEQE